MRVLFTTQVGEGHWRPLAPFALALRDAGHTVAFATTPFGCGVLAAHGFACFPAGDDEWLRPSRAPAREPTPARPPAQAPEVWSEVFVAVRAARALPDLLGLVAAWRPDLVVRELTEFAGCVAAERLGVPHATVQVGAFRPDLDAAIAAPLARLRAAAGLPPDPVTAMLYPHLLLTTVPPSFQDPARPLPPSARAVRLAAFDLAPDTDSPGAALAARVPGLPTVVATLGTAYNRTPGLFAAILAGLRDEPVNLIAALGPGLDPARFGPQPAHVHLARYVPLHDLLPHADLVVAHGGFGTTLAALDHGLPLVLLPVAADMPDNARRCAALGAGRIVGPDARTPEAIRDAVRVVLGDPTYRENAARLQVEMHGLPGMGHAVTLLERVARRQ
jgi:UDP:flavonoid glycosyltransferase YjiC (YdhE family)